MTWIHDGGERDSQVFFVVKMNRDDLGGPAAHTVGIDDPTGNSGPRV